MLDALFLFSIVVAATGYVLVAMALDEGANKKTQVLLAISAVGTVLMWQAGYRTSVAVASSRSECGILLTYHYLALSIWVGLAGSRNAVYAGVLLCRRDKRASRHALAGAILLVASFVMVSGTYAT